MPPLPCAPAWRLHQLRQPACPWVGGSLRAPGSGAAQAPGLPQASPSRPRALVGHAGNAGNRGILKTSGAGALKSYVVFNTAGGAWGWAGVPAGCAGRGAHSAVPPFCRM